MNENAEIFEAVCEWLDEQFDGAPEAIDVTWLSEFVADRLGKDRYVAAALERAALSDRRRLNK